MPTPSRARKFFSLAFSLSLVVTFLLFARWFMFIGGSKANPTFSFVSSTIRPPAPTTEPKDGEFLGGSKSTFIFKGNSIRPPAAEPATAPPIPPAE